MPKHQATSRDTTQFDERREEPVAIRVDSGERIFLSSGATSGSRTWQDSSGVEYPDVVGGLSKSPFECRAACDGAAGECSEK